MADACMPEKFYELAVPMLPPEKEIGPKGGRPPKTHHTVLKVIWFVLATGCRWKDVPIETGCCGETARSRMQSWEAAGIWRAVPANRSDQLEILPATLDFPVVGGKPGRPLTHPKQLYADAGFDCEATRVLLRWLGIEPHIRRRNSDHGSRLGRVRWVVERTISWIKGLRRMRVRYDRSQASIDAWTSIAAAVVCLHILLDAV